MLDVAIIGGGPAGLTAGLYAARAGLTVQIFEELFAGGQAAATEVMQNIIAWPEGISGVDFAMRLTEQAEKWGATLRYDRVTGLSLEQNPKVVQTTAGDVQAQTVILCMGKKPKPLGLDVPGEQRLTGRGVSYCATCDGALYQGMDVAVVGGGDVALRDVVYLARKCKHVALLHAGDSFDAKAQLQDVVQRLSNVTVYKHATVQSVDGEDKVSGVTFVGADKNAQTIAVQGVFVAVGDAAASAIALGVPTDENGYIVTDEEMYTGIPGVYAAGDVRHKALRQVVTAAADGAIAAHFAERYLTDKNKA